MKKLLLSLSTLVIFAIPKVSAQQIINADFETWTQDALASGTYDPNMGNGTSGWWDFNFANSFLLGSSPATVFRDNANPSPEHGTYCAKIISQIMSSTAYSFIQGLGYSDTNGIIITAFLNFSYPTFTFKPGIPINNALKSFSFYYRYIPTGGSGNDTCSCSVTMFHWNSVTGHSDLIGSGFWSNSNTVSNWTQATVTITYVHDSIAIPDTVVIGFSACALKSVNKPKPGDTMNIDNSSIVLAVGNITAEHDKVTIYPNPANNQVNMAITGQFQANHVEVYDITGKAIGIYTIYNNLLTINTSTYNSGLYFYKLLDDSRDQLSIGKFSVIR